MFKDYIFTLEVKDLDIDDIESSISVIEVSALTFIIPIGMVSITKGEEPALMATTIIAFLDKMNESFNILEIR